MDGASNQPEAWAADAVVLAVGVTAAQAIARSSPWLCERPEFRALQHLTTSDVLAARLWLDRRVPLMTPSNVVAGFDAGEFDLGFLPFHSIVCIALKCKPASWRVCRLY